MKWLVMTASLLVAGGVAAESPVAARDISGAYARTEPSGGDLRISREGDEWRISIVAGGLPNGMATAADCYAEAIGKLEGDALLAHLVPMDNKDMTVDQAVLDATPHGPIVIQFSGATATVRDQGAANFCGVGSEVGGLYTRVG